MKKEDLIKKLETIDLPDLKSSTHKIWLKNALINWKYKKPLSLPIRILKPASVLVALSVVILLISNVIYPVYTLAYVRNMAENDPQIKTILSEDNAKIKDVQIINNQAYILITPKDDEAGNQKATLAKMEIKERKVVEIKNIGSVTPTITQEEEDRAKKLLEKNEKEKDIIKNLGSSGESVIEIEEIIPLPTSFNNLKLEKKDGTIEVVEQKEIRVIYEKQGQRKEKEIDLNENEVKESRDK